ncbi:MAG TPA: phage tail tape measure protein [Polyangiaceae bacterium]|nr:phage tail tape measure protein [Polyangiaceae bacterium]
MLGAIETRTARFSRNVGGAINEASGAIDRIAGGLARVAAVGAGLGAVVGVGLSRIVTAGADFEHQMTTVGSVMGKSRAQIGDLTAEAMRLGVVTQFSSDEVGQAMEMLARKSFSSTEILAAIPGVLDAIAASGQGMAEVSTVVGSSIRSFGLEASKAAHVADVLALASTRTGATITDLGTAITIAGPAAKTLGVSLEDTASAIGLMMKMGIDSSTAGTAVSTMLTKLTKPSKEAATQMAAMGVKFKDAHGDALPFRDILGQLAKAGDKAGGNMDRLGFLAELIGLRGEKAGIQLADAFKTGVFDELATSLRNADGAAHHMASLNLDDTKGSWKLLTSTVGVLSDQLFELKSGPLRGVIDGTNAWLQANQALIVSGVMEFLEKASFGAEMFSHGMKDGFGSLRDGLGGVRGPLGVVDRLFDRFPSWPVAIRDVGFAIGTIGPVALGVAAAVKTAAFAMGVFNAVTEANPYLLVAGGVIALGTAFVVYRPQITAFAREHKVLLGIVGTGVGIFVAVKAATNAWQVALLLLELQQKAATAATWLANGARGALALGARAAGAAETFFIGEIGASAVATDGATTSLVAAEAATGALVATLGAATAAVGALALAWSQWQSLQGESGGHAWEGVKAVFGGRQSFFGAVDEAMDLDARRRFAKEHPGVGLPAVNQLPAVPAAVGLGAPIQVPGLPPGVAPASQAGALPSVPPQLAGVPAGSEQLQRLIDALERREHDALEVTVKAADGASAEVKQTGSGSKRPIKLTSSGAR